MGGIYHPLKSFFIVLFFRYCKHAPLRKFRVKGRNNPWFSPEIGSLLKERDVAWARSRKSKTDAGWLSFRQLRNKCQHLLYRELNLSSISLKPRKNLNDPNKFWKVIKASYGHVSASELPIYIVKESCIDKSAMRDCFYKHFISVGFIIWVLVPRDDHFWCAKLNIFFLHRVTMRLLMIGCLIICLSLM